MRNKLWIPFLVIVSFLMLVGFPVEHLFNQNRFELARRTSCQNSLRLISTALRASGLELERSNSTQIQRVIDSCNFACPSGLLVQSTRAMAGYFLSTNQEGQLNITESPYNHDPSRMRFVHLRTAQYYLLPDGKVRRDRQ
jgi:hypothetical protein